MGDDDGHQVKGWYPSSQALGGSVGGGAEVLQPLIPSGKLSHNYGKIHHFQWVNPLFQWPFSIAMLVYQRVRIWPRLGFRYQRLFCMFGWTIFFGGEYQAPISWDLRSPSSSSALMWSVPWRQLLGRGKARKSWTIHIHPRFFEKFVVFQPS